MLRIALFRETVPLTPAAKAAISGAVPHVCLARILDGRGVIRPALELRLLPSTLGDNTPYAVKDG